MLECCSVKWDNKAGHPFATAIAGSRRSHVDDAASASAQSLLPLPSFSQRVFGSRRAYPIRHAGLVYGCPGALTPLSLAWHENARASLASTLSATYGSNGLRLWCENDQVRR